MSEQTHTPGPWEIVQDAPENPKARFQIGHRVSPTSATYVCTIRTEKILTLDGNHAANARLIAAAPELLAALEEMLDVLDRNNVPAPAYLRKSEAQARAAIAKAKGQP